MRSTINAAIQQQWKVSQAGTVLRTPSGSKAFRIDDVSPNMIRITANVESAEGGTSMTIHREAFEEALLYLIEHQHNSTNPCEIQAHNLYALAGPLCRVSRDAALPEGPRVITYVLPILKSMGFVAMSDLRPTTAWAI